MRAFKVIFDCGETQYIKAKAVNSEDDTWIKFIDSCCYVNCDNGRFYRIMLNENNKIFKVYSPLVITYHEVSLEEFDKVMQMAIDYNHLMTKFVAL